MINSEKGYTYDNYPSINHIPDELVIFDNQFEGNNEILDENEGHLNNGYLCILQKTKKILLCLFMIVVGLIAVSVILTIPYLSLINQYVVEPRLAELRQERLCCQFNTTNSTQLPDNFKYCQSDYCNGINYNDQNLIDILVNIRFVSYTFYGFFVSLFSLFQFYYTFLFVVHIYKKY